MFQNLLCAIYHLKDDDLDYTLLSVDAKFMSKGNRDHARTSLLQIAFCHRGKAETI